MIRLDADCMKKPAEMMRSCRIKDAEKNPENIHDTRLFPAQHGADTRLIDVPVIGKFFV